MSATLPGVARLRALVAANTGLFFDETRDGFLEEVLARRLAGFAGDEARYFAELEGERAEREFLALASELTIGETYFFRHLDQFLAFSEVALPKRVLARAGSRPLKVLSAGASSGEEAYSLAILALEGGLESGRGIHLEGIDLNPKAVERAQSARYTTWSLRETSEELRKRWFRQDGREYVLERRIRDSVRFRQGSLTAVQLVPDDFDIIFCRNVLMYFAPETMRQVVSRLTRALAPGGYLFLGHAETLRGLSHDYHLCHTHNTFYYRKKSGEEQTAPMRFELETPPAPVPAAAGVTAAASAIPDGWTDGWLDTVQRTAERIRALADKPLAATPRSIPSAPFVPRPHHGRALELLGHERFSEALVELGEHRSDSPDDPDTLLLRAVLLTHSGQLDAAESVCRKLLALDELSAGAHYLLALCNERNGRIEAALDHDQTAVYLDPTLAMARLHLGLMARRAGDRQTARRELTQAALLLEREDASRLLMYGGGFGRDGLITLCRSELGRLGDGA